MSKLTKVGRGLFAVAVLSALGAGTTQAFAEPRLDPDASRTCYPMQCRQGCSEVGYRTGQCIDGLCECIY